MDPGEHHAATSSRPPTSANHRRFGHRSIKNVGAEQGQLVVVERRRRAGIAAAGVPRVLGHRRALCSSHGRVKERRVEFAKAPTGGLVDVQVSRDRHVGPVGELVALAPGEDVHQQILSTRRIDKPQAHRQAELWGVVMKAQGGELRLALGVELHFIDVDLGDKELHALLDIGSQQRLGARRNVVLLLAQPSVQAGGVLRREHDDLVLTDLKLSLDRDTQAAPRLTTAILEFGRPRAHLSLALVLPLRRAGVLLPVLDQARGRERIDVGKQLVAQGLDVVLLENDRHWHHHREVLRRPLIVVAHRQHRAGALAHHHHHGRVVKEIGIRAADIKTTEGIGHRRRKGEATGRQGEGERGDGQRAGTEETIGNPAEHDAPSLPASPNPARLKPEPQRPTRRPPRPPGDETTRAPDQRASARARVREPESQADRAAARPRKDPRSGRSARPIRAVQ